MRVNGHHAAAGHGARGAVKERGRHQLRPDVLDRVGTGVGDPTPRGMLLEVLMGSRRAGIEGAQHRLPHVVIPQRIQQ